MNSKRVVITGMGVVSPVGNNIDDFWKGLTEGKTAADKITSFDLEKYPTGSQIACEVKDFDENEYFDKKEARKLDKFCQFGLAAAEMAFKDSGLDKEKINSEKFGVLTGSGIGGINSLEEQHDILQSRGTRRVSPFFVPMMIGDILPGHISIKYGANGVNFGLISACATGSHAIGEAYRYIKDGSHDIMITGGAESAITPLSVGGFSNMRALSKRNDEPEKASRPFDRDRDGFVIGEGAGMLVIESLEHAKARGAKIYAEIAGYGASGDAFHITAPCEDGYGAQLAMKKAVSSAGINPEDVTYINAHGTSTPPNDVVETRAIKAVFGEHAYNLKISSIKSMIGHLLGAAGGVETISSALTLFTGIIPPTMNCDNPEEECDLDYTPHKAVKYDVKYVLSNNFGFGGHNASILLKKYENS